MNNIELEKKVTEIEAALKRVVSHPEAICIDLSPDGNLKIRGVALVEEQHDISESLSKINGLKQIDNKISFVSHQKNPKGLNSKLVPANAQELSSKLSGTARFILGLTGSLVAFYGVRKKSLQGSFLAVVGMGAIVRALSNLETSYLMSYLFRPTFRVKCEIDVWAPIDVVFDFWANFSNYSKFMSYVEDVQVNETGGLTWKMTGPSNIQVHWDADLFHFVANREIHWKSRTGSIVMNSGDIFFQSLPNGRTRVVSILSYALPAGLLGYGLVKFLGFDPQDRIENDLFIMKVLIENELNQEAVSA